MDNQDEYEFIPDKMVRYEQTPDSFITLCKLIKNQELRYDDAWDIVKDIVRANAYRDSRPF